MESKKLRNSLIKHIKEIATAFSTTELAFYCLTNSFELHLRDKLSYRLQNQYPRSIILREWKKVDISIHDKNMVVKSLIEIKYSFSSMIVRRQDPTRSRLLKSLKNQYIRDKRMSKNWYGLIFISCPESKISNKYAAQVKNRNAVNKYAGVYSSRMWRRKIKQIITLHFPEKKFIIKSASVQAGRCFETNVDLLWFLITGRNR